VNRALPGLAALIAIALLAGCAGMGRVDALPGGIAAEDESRLVILAVDNADAAPPPRPASTRPSYLGATYAASDAARATLREIAREYGLHEVTAWPIAVLKLHCAVLRIPAGGKREELLARLSQDPRVRLAQTMNDFTPRTDYNDPYLNLQRGFRSMDAADAQQWSRGEDVRVAIVDTGLDAGHPDFGGRVVVQRNFVDRDAARFAQDRHGTAVAGVISAAANNSLGIVGIAPRVQIVALKACWQQDARGDTARCNSLTLAQALAAAIDERVQIVNLSLTGPRDPLLNSLVSAGTERGILYVGAAPADGAADGFPGGAPGVIPVDMSESGKARNGVLRAPGREVVTLVPGGHYDFVSGPSLATAHVSGAVALLLARNRKLDRGEIYELLSHSTQGAADGPGMAINACRALAELLPQASCGAPRSAAALE
jgi:hypothetical protein